MHACCLHPSVRGFYWNAAVTFFGLSIVRAHVGEFPESEHAPPHLMKVWRLRDIAVRVTTVPALNSAAQTLPHRMPKGLLMTVPARLLGRVSP